MSSKTPKSNDAKTESAPNNSIPPVLLVLLAIAVLIASYVAFSLLPDRTLMINGERVNVLIADSSEERARGLGGRESLSKDQGMLFVFSEPSQYCFWMKDMNFSIDMVWLDKDKKVTTIASNVTPESYPKSFCPKGEAKYVLEVPAGHAAELHLKEGDQAQFKL